jgi:gliding motility-associated-like protein
MDSMIKIVALAVFCLFGTLAKAQNPDPPVITYLSVDSLTQQVEINWVNTDPDVEGYIIYFQTSSGLWVPIDTLNGNAINTYTTTQSNAATEQETYSVVSFDANGNNSPRSAAHYTLFLQVNYKACDQHIELVWSPYDDMLALDGYFLRVLEEDVLTGMTIAVDVPLTENDSLYHYAASYSKRYTFTMIAYDLLGKYARSNKLVKESTRIIFPDYLYINAVSVDEDDQIEVRAICNSADIARVDFYRSALGGEYAQKIGEAPLLEEEAVFLDKFTRPEEFLYYYSARAIDVCENEYELPVFKDSSQLAQVHHLQLSLLERSSDELLVNWEAYTGFLGSVKHELWLSVDGQERFLRDVDYSNQERVDLSRESGNVCLFVKAVEGDDNPLQRKDSVLSNRQCIQRAPILHIPSVFTPDNGDYKNDEWRMSFHGDQSVRDYHLMVFNQWGMKVFESRSLYEAWDGTYGGGKLPEGVYIYQLRYGYGTTALVEQNGKVQLLR